MKLFSQAQMSVIQQAAERSNSPRASKSPTNDRKISSTLAELTKYVLDYFKDSQSILITSAEQLHEYVDNLIAAGEGGVDTETTGLDRSRDTIVGSSLYYPGGVECYIPNTHLIPIFDEPYKNQLTYKEAGREFQRIKDAGVRLITANGDFDVSMIFKDYKVDLCDNVYYDVILAWRCLKEDEPHKDLKTLYNKYVLKGAGDPKRFSDFFTPQLFPYCNPDVAKLYAANDAKITYHLFKWQLPFCTKSNPKCTRAKLEGIADLIWNVEFPLMKVCQMMHRNGIFIDKTTSAALLERYNTIQSDEQKVLADMVQKIIEDAPYVSKLTKPPFYSGQDFNPKSTTHVKYLLSDLMKINLGESGSTGKDALNELNLPVTNQILKVRSLGVLISTFVEKLPQATTSDSRIHCTFRQIGANTGRMSSSDPKRAYWGRKIKLTAGRAMNIA